MADMGKRFRQARLEAGLSQAQLCKDVISRNMLSLIESGAAKPSLSTLEILAERLQKPAGYFFGEDTEDFSGRKRMESAWIYYKEGKITEAARILESQKDLEKFQDVSVLKLLVLLKLAQQAAEEKRDPYARKILHEVIQKAESFPELQRRALLLLGALEGQRAEPICRKLPSLDEELLLRARASLEAKDPDRAAKLLEAAEDHQSPEWAMLRGRTYLLEGHFRSAARCFHHAEQAFPTETSPYLEQCYRELEDYKQAYFYACRQK